jgi:hypothetical protein
MISRKCLVATSGHNDIFIFHSIYIQFTKLNCSDIWLYHTQMIAIKKVTDEMVIMSVDGLRFVCSWIFHVCCNVSFKVDSVDSWWTLL